MGLFKKKSTVDPVDVLVLKNEIAALKERLDASEQAKAQLADQISSLAATTMVLSSNNRTDASDIVEQLEFIERRLEATESVNPKLDALARRINEVASRASAPGAPVDNSVLAARLEQVAALAAAPAQPDDELAARLIQLERTATSVESLNRQIVVLTATVSAQTNVSEQVAELAERIDELQAAPAPQQQAPVVVAAPAPDLSPQLAELAARIDQVAKLATEPAQPDRELAARLEQLEANAQQLEVLNYQFAVLAHQVDTHGDVRDQLVAITERVDEMSRNGLSTGQLELDLAELVASSDRSKQLGEELSQLRSLTERLGATEEDARRAREQVGALEQRLGQMGTELTNQLGELSSEIDALAARPVAVAGDASSEQLRSGQVKLAAEQARFEILFREDLARLAEQLQQLKQRG